MTLNCVATREKLKSFGDSQTRPTAHPTKYYVTIFKRPGSSIVEPMCPTYIAVLMCLGSGMPCLTVVSPKYQGGKCATMVRTKGRGPASELTPKPHPHC